MNQFKEIYNTIEKLLNDKSELIKTLMFLMVV